VTISSLQIRTFDCSSIKRRQSIGTVRLRARDSTSLSWKRAALARTTSCRGFPDQNVLASPSIGRGKGAIEMAAIQHAITESIGLDSGSTLYKCTGRLPLLNVARCIGELERGSVRARMTLDRSSADTRLIGATVQEWKNLLFNTAGLVDDAHGIYFERVVASRIASALALGRCRLNRFPVRPIFGGISGTSGRRYSPRLSQARHFLLHPMELVMVKVAAHKQV
jgi:hypothetical protein